MSTVTETSDSQMLELLRRRGPLGISELSTAMSVTSTAVRQRLTRLMAQGLVTRELTKRGRGRPSHCYLLTEKARRQAGQNFSDLAMALWEELRAVKNIEIRRGLMRRIAGRLSEAYRGQTLGTSLAERMDSVKKVFADRNVGLEVDRSRALPVLLVHDCPYPELAALDRGVCTMEKMLFENLVGQDLKLAECRLDGHTCCEFQTN